MPRRRRRSTAIPPTGSLLGLEETTAITDVTDTLGPGDALVLYTDGVIEARRDHDLFGEERLRAALAGAAGSSAEEIAAAIHKATIDFAGTTDDDLAILVVRQLS